MTKIVTIGGGTGQFTLLSGLKRVPDAELIAVVSMADSGGSSGRLRDELGALPPGDVLKALLALSELPGDVARDLLQHRFAEGALDGHTSGNMLLTMLASYSGSFLEAVRGLGNMLKVRGTVLPVTTGNITLRARLVDGTVLVGETVIDVPTVAARSRIADVWLEPNALALPQVTAAMKTADLIVLGPGDVYTSVIPVLLVRGVAEALRETHARLVYVCNTMTKPGETDGFTAAQFVTVVEDVLGRSVDAVVVNSAHPDTTVAARYAAVGSFPVENNLRGARVIAADLLRKAELARHDPDKLAAAVLVGR